MYLIQGVGMNFNTETIQSGLLLSSSASQYLKIFKDASVVSSVGANRNVSSCIYIKNQISLYISMLSYSVPILVRCYIIYIYISYSLERLF